jgi:predicted Ser/Thr protein kinase
MLMGQKLGSYSLEKELGSGAMGTVYRARNDKSGARVAVKVLSFGLGHNKKAKERFEREIEVLKQLDHTNIVRYVNHGRYQGTDYIAMEFIDGETLDNVMQRRGRFTWEEVVEMGRQICAALQHAHHAGIIHRDLKPSNLMVTRDGTVKLTDFGIAKDLDESGLTSAHCTVGTAAYMSPEQCRGEKQLTHRSDLYSMGVLLYELVTGQKPFQAETPMEMFMQHTQGTFERPARLVLDIPVWLDNLICQLLQKKPEDRGFDAAAVGDSLDRVLEKVSAQESAGVAAAKTRIMKAVERTRIEDATDKKAARTLLTSVHGRRKRRETPFYQKVWFQACAFSTGLVVVVLLLAWVWWPKSANTLFQEAQQLMAAGSAESRSKARSGPIEYYLSRFGERDDEQARQMNKWADDYDKQELRDVWAKRKASIFPPQERAEEIYRDATRAEDAGELAVAAKTWAALEQVDADTPRDTRLRRDFGADRKKEVLAALALEESLKRPAAADTQRGGVQGLAQLALRYEAFGDTAYARDRWLEVRRTASERPWALLGAKRAKELKPVSEPVKTRLKLIQGKLKEAQDMADATPQSSRAICEEIRQLYGQDPDSGVRELVKKAEGLLSKLTS